MTSGTETGASTPAGSDPVSAAQRQAVQAYVNTLLDPDLAGPAGEDAIAAFGQALAQREAADQDPASPVANETLLALTRLMAAVSVPDASEPADRRQAVRASINSAAHVTCRESAALLATRANGNIAPHESAALDAHLASCARCRDLAARTDAAEQAFRRELAPRAGSGRRLPAVPRAAYGLLAVLIAAGVGTVALVSGGSHHPSNQAAAPISVKTTNVAVAVPTLPVATAAGSHTAHGSRARAGHATTPESRTHRRHARGSHSAKGGTHAGQHHVTRRSTSSGTSTAAVSPGGSHSSASTGATSSASSAGTYSPAASAPTSASSAAQSATPTPSSSPAPTASSSAPAPSSASAGTAAGTSNSTSGAVSSGASSLPADSAPQQGIGSLTTGQ